jgi:hypothetical protein
MSMPMVAWPYVGRASSLGALAQVAPQLTASPSPIPRHASTPILDLGIRTSTIDGSISGLGTCLCTDGQRQLKVPVTLYFQYYDTCIIKSRISDPGISHSELLPLSWPCRIFVPAKDFLHSRNSCANKRLKALPILFNVYCILIRTQSVP